MSQEIERKFLVLNNNFITKAYDEEKIKQGYLSSNPERTVRVRLKGESAYLTIKGKSSDDGVSRYEWEREIRVSDAEELLLLCEPGLIEKTRYYVLVGDNVFEVDVFVGDNEGLIVAELELADESEQFSRPEWLGEEVTGDKKYYNAELALKPYKEWGK